MIPEARKQTLRLLSKRLRAQGYPKIIVAVSCARVLGVLTHNEARRLYDLATLHAYSKQHTFGHPYA